MDLKKSTAELVQERLAPDKLAEMPRTSINVLVDNVRSLDNVGMMIRMCELARVEKLYLGGYTGHPRIDGDEREEGLIARHESRIFKTAVYAMGLQPWEYCKDPVPVVGRLKEEGNKIVVLEQTKNSVAYNSVSASDYELPVTIVAGHERQGVRQEIVDMADTVVEIPILGSGNSHNVATAVGIVLYHILDQNRLI